MSFLDKLTHKTEEKIQDNDEPVSIEEIEDLISVIDLAHKVNAIFDLCLMLRNGGFAVDSTTFKGIKFLKKTKNDSDRLIISHCNALLSTDTTINIEDIIHINLQLTFTDKIKEGE